MLVKKNFFFESITDSISYLPMDEFFRQKKVCLLGCGSSLGSRTVDYSKYDTVCGTNRIYKTSYFENIEVLFDGSHYMFDPFNDEKINRLNSGKNLKFIVFSCGFYSYDVIKEKSVRLGKKFFLKYRDGALNDPPTHRKSIGTEAFLSIVSHCPLILDVFGIDFHKSSYIEELANDPTHPDPLLLHDYLFEEKLCRFVAAEYNELHPNSITFY